MDARDRAYLSFCPHDGGGYANFGAGFQPSDGCFFPIRHESRRKRRVVALVRKKERVRFPEEPGVQDVQYYFECLDFRATDRKLSAYLADFQDTPAEKARPHEHPGIEFLYVLKGSLTLKIASEEYVLEPEDAIYFDSAAPHSYRRRGAKPCTGIVISVS